jgi:hypothetical protein
VKGSVFDPHHQKEKEKIVDKAEEKLELLHPAVGNIKRYNIFGRHIKCSLKIKNRTSL